MYGTSHLAGWLRNALCGCILAFPGLVAAWSESGDPRYAGVLTLRHDIPWLKKFAGNFASGYVYSTNQFGYLTGSNFYAGTMHHPWRFPQGDHYVNLPMAPFDYATQITSPFHPTRYNTNPFNRVGPGNVGQNIYASPATNVWCAFNVWVSTRGLDIPYYTNCIFYLRPNIFLTNAPITAKLTNDVQLFYWQEGYEYTNYAGWYDGGRLLYLKVPQSVSNAPSLTLNSNQLQIVARTIDENNHWVDVKRWQFEPGDLSFVARDINYVNAGLQRYVRENPPFVFQSQLTQSNVTPRAKLLITGFDYAPDTQTLSLSLSGLSNVVGHHCFGWSCR